MSTEDDHPVRSIFIDAVANRCKMETEKARKYVAPISTDLIDRFWPIEEVVAQHERGDLVAVFYPKKDNLVITPGIH